MDEKRYTQWLKTDVPKRNPILADAKSTMRRWFEQGVIYEWGCAPAPLHLLRIPIYTNQPEELQGILEIAQGKLTTNILTQLGIPKDTWVPLIMCTPAERPSGGKKRTATFNIRADAIPPPGIVYKTEGLPAETRAEIVASSWYNCTARWVFKYITQNEPSRTLYEVRDYLDIENRLKSLNLGKLRRVEYHACSQKYQYQEVSKALRNLGVARSPEAIRKSYQRKKAEYEADLKRLDELKMALRDVRNPR